MNVLYNIISLLIYSIFQVFKDKCFQEISFDIFHSYFACSWTNCGRSTSSFVILIEIRNKSLFQSLKNLQKMSYFSHKPKSQRGCVHDMVKKLNFTHLEPVFCCFFCFVAKMQLGMTSEILENSKSDECGHTCDFLNCCKIVVFVYII